jgi:hypothetical protein
MARIKTAILAITIEKTIKPTYLPQGPKERNMVDIYGNDKHESPYIRSVYHNLRLLTVV